MENLIIIAIVLIIAGLAAWYIIKEKKKGAKCIGCPYSKQCNGKCKD
jgi:radical SAM protein with 4Fe4S-binding SPASM domain